MKNSCAHLALAATTTFATFAIPHNAVAQTKTSTASAPAGNKPNILFILMDNLGYGEPGCYGGGEVRGAPTPIVTHRFTTSRTALYHRFLPPLHQPPPSFSLEIQSP